MSKTLGIIESDRGNGYALPDCYSLSDTDADKNKPFISVIIPVYNAEKYLEQCLDSVTNQTFKNIEIICINDKSNDNSEQILECYAKKDKRIIIIDNNENVGGGLTRNKGLSAARGEYIHFLDSDDWVKTNLYEKIAESIKKHQPEIIEFAYQIFNEQQQEFNDVILSGCQELKGKIFEPVKAPEVFHNIETIWKCIYSKKFLDENSIIFKNITCHHDTPFYIECLLKTKKMMVTDDIFYYYRYYRTDSITALKYDNFHSYFDWYDALKSLITDCNETVCEILCSRMTNPMIYEYITLIIKKTGLAVKHWKKMKKWAMNDELDKYVSSELKIMINSLRNDNMLVYFSKICIKHYSPRVFNLLHNLKKFKLPLNKSVS